VVKKFIFSLGDAPFSNDIIGRLHIIKLQMIPKELIDKYFRNECSEEEKKLVLEYFRNSPEEWNKYMTAEDWDNFTVSRELDPKLSKRLFQAVSRNSFKKGRRVRTPGWQLRCQPDWSSDYYGSISLVKRILLHRQGTLTEQLRA